MSETKRIFGFTKCCRHFKSSDQQQQLHKILTASTKAKKSSGRKRTFILLTKENEYLVQELTKMAVDVYNDALHGTLSDKSAMVLSSFFSLSSFKKSEFHEIREKVARSSISFLSKRLNIEQENSIQLRKSVLTAKTCVTFIHHVVNAMNLFIRKDDQQKINALVNDICEQRTRTTPMATRSFCGSS